MANRLQARVGRDRSAAGRSIPRSTTRSSRAAAQMLLEGGLQRMTVPGVAAAAGVAKTTVYRRYATPAQLALAAIGRLNATRHGPGHRLGAHRPDPDARERCAQRIDPTVTATVLVEAQTHPEILEAAREQMIGPAVERFRRVLRKGVAARRAAGRTWTSTSPPTPSSAATSPATTSAAAPGRNGRSRWWTRSTRG